MNSFLNKYTPNDIGDFNININVIKLLELYISINKLNILIIGDSETGKTKLIYKLLESYYNTKNLINNENILILNNLNDQGIQFYRNEVKTFCQTKSSLLNKKKTIILDDIDFINEQSQQIFRNYIDKYSNNINFIASCSSLQKVIDNLQSRITLIPLLKVTPIILSDIYDKITQNENIKLSNEFKEIIMTYSNNSIRTLVNYIEKIYLINSKLTKDDLIQICTNINNSNFKIYTTSCLENKDINAAKILLDIFNNGYSIIDILDNYFTYIKHATTLNEEIKYKISKIICKYITIFNDIHEDEIELLFITHDIINLNTQ